ncbi:hypothetical protein PsYK624_132200 [Phanerochaete sordida]|uniref:Uncharacterized protein n=1 Tax=Phanerochaete sordida TaxID=48140 RepID=A0A9P3GKN9_9APHY|nr:hypothetical protein PsYK624_132200 [Phanerochaete sordida]
MVVKDVSSWLNKPYNTSEHKDIAADRQRPPGIPSRTPDTVDPVNPSPRPLLEAHSRRWNATSGGIGIETDSIAAYSFS